MPVTFLRRKALRYLLLIILLGSGLLLLSKISPFFRINDFIEFWSGARVNYTGGNPYSPVDLLEVQKQSGWIKSEPKLMVYPPWIFPLFFLFSLFKLSTAQLLWLLFQISVILFSTYQIWLIWDGPTKHRWLAWVVPLLFAPTILVLQIGQITPLILMGLTGFIYSLECKPNDGLAGICLGLTAIKPQLVIVFWIVLLLWIIHQHRWVILVSAGLTVVCLTLLAYIFNPQVILQYLDMAKANAISVWASPTIGAYLRLLLIGADKFWPQFIPPVVGGLWAIFYWKKHYRTWDWLDELPVILLVSIITSAYAWTYDFVILLPVILVVVIRLLNGGTRWINYLLIGIFIVISLLDFVLHIFLSDFWFIWLGPALLIWYLVSNTIYQKKVELTE